MKHYPRIILVPLITISESRSVLSRSRIKQRDNLKLRIRRATLRAKIIFIFFCGSISLTFVCLKFFTSVFGLYAWIPPIAEQAYYAPKNPRHYANAEYQQHYAFSFGGRGRCCLVFPSSFYYICQYQCSAVGIDFF